VAAGGVAADQDGSGVGGADRGLEHDVRDLVDDVVGRERDGAESSGEEREDREQARFGSVGERGRHA
jgi:hypothetical protein